MVTFQPRRSWSRSVKLTVPSATRLARTWPVNAFESEPTRSIVAPCGSLRLPAEVLPKPKTAVLPSRTAPITSAGTLLCRKKTVPMNLTISSSSLSAAIALPPTLVSRLRMARRVRRVCRPPRPQPHRDDTPGLSGLPLRSRLTDREQAFSRARRGGVRRISGDPQRRSSPDEPRQLGRLPQQSRDRWHESECQPPARLCSGVRRPGQLSLRR